jgi:hypothetical protein
MKGLLTDRTKDYLFILLLAIIAYWPVSFMVFSVKNDAIHYFLAMRYNTSEAIQHGYFPSWTSYINMGYPLHADMQSGVWNPVVFLMSLIRKYDIYWLQAETIITIIISGISMYHLLKYFKLNRKVVLTVSAAYMLNGYITDAGQFLNWLYAAAYLPFVFLSVIRCFDSFKIKDAFLLGLSFSLMLLSSYPADFILLFYILLAFIIIAFIRYKKQNGTRQAVRLFGRQIVISAACFIIICLPAIISYIPFIQSITRGTGVDVDTALINSLAPVNLISFATPWPTLNATWHQYTDPLIRNCYPGIVLLIFLIFFLLQKKKKSFLQKFLLGMFVFFLLFSFGKLGGIRVLSYYTLPLMNTFRHPANAKLFFIFAGQLIAAFAIHDFFTNISFNKALLRRITLVSLSIILSMMLIGFFKGHIWDSVQSLFGDESGSGKYVLKKIKDNLSFFDLLFLNAAWLTIILFTFYWLLKKEKLKKYLVPVVIAEMLIVAQGMIPLTYVRQSAPEQVQEIINRQPSGYPLPDISNTIAEYSENGMKYFDISGCLNPYNKKPGRSDYIITPANLSTQEIFWDYTAFRKKIIQYPLLYFADTFYATKDTSAFILSASLKKAAITESLILSNQTYSPDSNASILLKKFLPGKVVLETENVNPSFLVFLQNKYPNWVAYVNGQKTTIFKTNLSFMGLHLPAGRNNIEFIYKDNYLKLLGLISVLFVLSSLIYIYIPSKKEN